MHLSQRRLQTRRQNINWSSSNALALKGDGRWNSHCFIARYAQNTPTGFQINPFYGEFYWKAESGFILVPLRKSAKEPLSYPEVSSLNSGKVQVDQLRRMYVTMIMATHIMETKLCVLNLSSYMLFN